MNANATEHTYLCKDCRWWGKYITGCCDKVGSPDPEENDAGFDLILEADDDQGLDGQLKTGPEFGCVQFEPNAEKTFEKITEACCDNEDRTMAGGCRNCGDPAL